MEPTDPVAGRRRGLRRRFLGLGAALVMGLAASVSRAETPIRIVVPVNAGGTLDGLGRLLARHLAGVMNEPVIVENRPGASAVIGTEQVVRSRPDGRTLLLGSSFIATNVVMSRLNFDPLTDLKAVITLSEGETMLAVHGALEIRSVADLVEAARRKPGGLNCGAPPGQLAFGCERLRLLLGGHLVSIPYAGVAPALTALAGGQVDLMLAPRASLSPVVATGKVRALASAGPRKASAPYQHLPLLKDTWPEMVSYGYAAIYVAAQTPAPMVDALNDALNRVLAMPDARQGMLELGYHPVGGPVDLPARLLAQEIASYTRLAAQIGLKPP